MGSFTDCTSFLTKLYEREPVQIHSEKQLLRDLHLTHKAMAVEGKDKSSCVCIDLQWRLSCNELCTAVALIQGSSGCLLSLKMLSKLLALDTIHGRSCRAEEEHILNIFVPVDPTVCSYVY